MTTTPRRRRRVPFVLSRIDRRAAGGRGLTIFLFIIADGGSPSVGHRLCPVMSGSDERRHEQKGSKGDEGSTHLGDREAALCAINRRRPLSRNAPANTAAKGAARGGAVAEASSCSATIQREQLRSAFFLLSSLSFAFPPLLLGGQR